MFLNPPPCLNLNNFGTKVLTQNYPSNLICIFEPYHECLHTGKVWLQFCYCRHEALNGKWNYMTNKCLVLSLCKEWLCFCFAFWNDCMKLSLMHCLCSQLICFASFSVIFLVIIFCPLVFFLYLSRVHPLTCFYIPLHSLSPALTFIIFTHMIISSSVSFLLLFSLHILSASYLSHLLLSRLHSLLTACTSDFPFPFVKYPSPSNPFPFITFPRTSALPFLCCNPFLPCSSPLYLSLKEPPPLSHYRYLPFLPLPNHCRFP